MFDNQLASILENTQVNLFGNIESDSAVQRINAVIAMSIREGDNAKELPLPQQICFITDCIIVGEATLEMLETNDEFRGHILAMGGVELLGQSINIKRAELTTLRDTLVVFKKNLS
jgi:hypothetical protein